MTQKKLANKAARLVLAAGLVIGATAAAGAQTTHASGDDMGCYGWFDYVYKSTHDMNFAYYHYLVCRGEAVAPALHQAVDIDPILTPITIDPAGGGGTFTPRSPGGSFTPVTSGPAGPGGPTSPIVPIGGGLHPIGRN